jgi:hypothetical protein
MTPRWLRIALLVPVVAASCTTADRGADDADRPAAHDPVDAALARTLCAHLVVFVNHEVIAANDMALSVTDATSSQARFDHLLEGWDRVVAEARLHEQRTRELSLPPAAESPTLLAELQDGAAAATRVLAGRRAELAAFGPFDQSSEPGVIGTAFTGIEKGFALSEPAVFRYERRSLREAFDDEPGCEHVVQWTGT